MGHESEVLHVNSNCRDCTLCCWCRSLVDQHISANAAALQNLGQRSSSDRSNTMAAFSVWGTRLAQWCSAATSTLKSQEFGKLEQGHGGHFLLDGLHAPVFAVHESQHKANG